jgi:beta-lactamase class C
MISTMLPRGDDGPRGRLTPEYKSRAVQGYADDSEPIGQSGEQTSYYDWPGTGRMYSSPRDMMAFLAAQSRRIASGPVDMTRWHCAP